MRHKTDNKQGGERVDTHAARAHVGAERPATLQLACFKGNK